MGQKLNGTDVVGTCEENQRAYMAISVSSLRALLTPGGSLQYHTLLHIYPPSSSAYCKSAYSTCLSPEETAAKASEEAGWAAALRACCEGNEKKTGCGSSQRTWC